MATASKKKPTSPAETNRFGNSAVPPSFPKGDLPPGGILRQPDDTIPEGYCTIGDFMLEQMYPGKSDEAIAAILDKEEPKSLERMAALLVDLISIEQRVGEFAIEYPAALLHRIKRTLRPYRVGFSAPTWHEFSELVDTIRRAFICSIFDATPIRPTAAQWEAKGKSYLSYSPPGGCWTFELYPSAEQPYPISSDTDVFASELAQASFLKIVTVHGGLAS